MPAFDVTCPCCRATLTVSGDAQSVLKFKEAPKPKAVSDLTEAARALQKDPERREELFKQSLETEKNKGDKLKKSFNDLFKRAAEEPLERPTRDMDLD
ncbi:MAG TPA: hypothetical protein PKB12_03325 [Elusimicrobiota bacterium]|jgi:Zn-finger nucleic acid-binding protein|nr:hypothetical protein [Elusimicrobiota bacterium]HMX42727.1 hypothetical protein [Elusimicrobiota bacterium]HMX93691.1 hypothetical protein [Elusimicrobiota bacterium]HMZ26327.1 hypothetical protein [Elusimicrobiota bacterium]HNA60436.1 hypothetical protein [Elusimicrobiota bacterium]